MAAAIFALPATALSSSRRCSVAVSSGNAPHARAAAPLRRSAPSLQQPTTSSLRHQRRSLVCRAAGGEEGQQQPPAAEQQQGQEQQQAAAERWPAAVDPSVAKGQRTAIVTGAISIIFGVIYLGLVSFLDMRGGELLPPPPEAYIP